MTVHPTSWPDIARRMRPSGRIEQLFVTVGFVSRPLTVGEVVTMRRSLGMAPNLPAAQVRQLLDEVERLLRLESDVEAIVVRTRAPFGDVRGNLNDLAKLVGRE